MRELIASFPHSQFETYYFFSLYCWIILSIGALGTVMYLDRDKIFVQKDRNYMRGLFASRPKAAKILLFMFGSAYLLVVGLIILGSLSKRYSGGLG